MNVTFYVDLGVLGDEVRLDVDIIRFYPGDPGRTYGPPEKCYPPESEEFDIGDILVYFDGEDKPPMTITTKDDAWRGLYGYLESCPEFSEAVIEECSEDTSAADEAEWYAELNRGYAQDRA